MRIVIQRVRSASVRVGDQHVATIGHGLLALVGFAAADTLESAPLTRLAERLVKLRIFGDDEGKLNHSVQQVDGEILLVSQVTLTADIHKGNRPSFHTAAPPEISRTLFEEFVLAVKHAYPKVATGVFQAHMVVSLENDGPVTLLVDSRKEW